MDNLKSLKLELDRVSEYWNITLERLQTSEKALSQTLASLEELKRHHELDKISHKHRILDLTHQHKEKNLQAFDDLCDQIIQQIEREYQRIVDSISSDAKSKFFTCNNESLQKIQELESTVTKIARETTAFQQKHGSQLANVHQQHLQRIEAIINNLTKRYEDEKEFIVRKAEQIIWDIADNFSACDKCP
eukprot:jgi/Picsp_1/6572/NSC_03915-R1_---NA---